jgi:UDP-4-amino-4-deoxy-L-arabinose-oxoglutarate aminotransferase
MRSEFLPFSRPDISEADIAAVGEVLRSGWITTGTKNAEFEQKFSEYTGAQHSVALASATAGMHLLLHALDIGAGDEVITPSMTWVSTVNLIKLCGASPVFVDVDKDTLMTDAARIAEKLTAHTRLIIPVHFAGAAVDMQPIRELAATKNIALAEDAAHAAGTTYYGEPIGKHGTAIFSFHPIKNMTTGEGGMFCSDNAELAARIRRLKFHGLGVDAFDRQMQGRSPQAEVLEPAYKYNLTDIAAVLAQHYHHLLADVPEVQPLRVPSYEMHHAWHLFIVRLDIDKVGFSRDEFMQRLKARNIGTGLHFKAVHSQKYYVETMGAQDLPNTEWNSARICSLPLFPEMTLADVEDVVATIKEVLTA